MYESLKNARLDAALPGGGGGNLAPGRNEPRFGRNLDPLEQLRSLSHAMFPEWCKQLQKNLASMWGFRQSGGVYLASTPGELATLSAQQAWWSDHGIVFERWSTSELASHVPRLASAKKTGVRAAWFLPDEYQIRNLVIYGLYRWLAGNAA